MIPAPLNDCKVSEEKVNEIYTVDLIRDLTSGVEKILKAMNLDVTRSWKYASKVDKLTINLYGAYWNSLLILINVKVISRSVNQFENLCSQIRRMTLHKLWIWGITQHKLSSRLVRPSMRRCVAIICICVT
jgi:hypothetical protein